MIHVRLHSPIFDALNLLVVLYETLMFLQNEYMILLRSDFYSDVRSIQYITLNAHVRYMDVGHTFNEKSLSYYNEWFPCLCDPEMDGLFCSCAYLFALKY